MATPAIYGVLGQVQPSAGVLTTLYTVPAGRKTVCRVIVASTALSSLFRVSVGVAGAPDAPFQALAYDERIAANDSLSSVPITVNGGDVVRVQSDSGTLAFTLSGIEQDQ